jgi:hypothetical protein
MLDFSIAAIVGAAISILASVLTAIFAWHSARRSFKVRLGAQEVELKAGDIDRNLAQLEPLIHETTRSPRVFLSYTRSDSDFARRLANDLEKNGLRVWLDEREIAVGDKLADKLVSGMESSQWIVPVLSPEATSSSWFKRELQLALHQEERRRRSLVLPVLYKGDRVPEGLSERVYADFRSNYYSGLGNLVAAIRREHAPRAESNDAQ